MDKLKFSLFAAAAMCALSANAVTLPDIVGDGMVLQQNADARLWGWSSVGADVKVTTSWNGASYDTRADEKGRWSVAVATPQASYDKHTITVADADGSVSINDVLVGEVWFCSGQSNMEMPLNGFWTQPVEGSDRAIAYSGRYGGKIRMATVAKTAAMVPADSVDGEWKECCPANARWFSAVGYYFAEALNNLLDVPVGIINCSWGGSHVEGWLPSEELSKYTDVDLSQVGNKDVREWDQPMIMYNGMLHPLIGYTVKGFLWNQGESNINQHDTYPQRLARMVEIWREQWNQGASDLSKPYEAEDIHASMKQPIGERLAWMAAVRTYGIEGIACDSPTFKSMEVDGNSALLHFDNAEGGFTPNRNLSGFEVAGADGVFYPAEAVAIDRDIRVTSDKVGRIAEVRYCFRNWMPGKVHSTDWLPLVPFRAVAD